MEEKLQLEDVTIFEKGSGSDSTSRGLGHDLEDDAVMAQMGKKQQLTVRFCNSYC